VAIETVPAGASRVVPLGYRVQFPSGTPSIFGDPAPLQPP
jgi:hypothetical protein